MLHDSGSGKDVPVLAKFAPTTKTKLVLERLDGDKIKVTSETSPGEMVVLKDEVLEVRVKWGQLRIARKPRAHDADDPYVPPYDPYGDGEVLTVVDPQRDA